MAPSTPGDAHDMDRLDQLDALLGRFPEGDQQAR